jgi:hypothetical protein
MGNLHLPVMTGYALVPLTCNPKSGARLLSNGPLEKFGASSKNTERTLRSADYLSGRVSLHVCSVINVTSLAAATTGESTRDAKH